MKIINSQGQTLERVEVYPGSYFSPHGQEYAALYRYSSFVNLSVAVSLLKGIENVQKMITSDVLIDKCFKVSLHKLTFVD
jgi:hypothetical protein